MNADREAKHTIIDQNGILQVVRSDPLGFRRMLEDVEVQWALNNIGVLTTIVELHAPSLNARTSTGRGSTLCGIKGTRHTQVTCKRCLKALDCKVAPRR